MFNFSGGSNVIKCHEDIAKFSKSTDCASVMLARCAMWNPSIFCKSGMKPLDEVIKKFLRYVRYIACLFSQMLASDYENWFIKIIIFSLLRY